MHCITFLMSLIAMSLRNEVVTTMHCIAFLMSPIAMSLRNEVVTTSCKLHQLKQIYCN